MEINGGPTEGAPAQPGQTHPNVFYSDQPTTAEEFRARQLRARDMLRGDLEGEDLEKLIEEAVVATTLDRALDWARSQTIFPMTFGLACCAIEMMSTVSARYDIARFGSEAFRASPRQADLIILSGRVSIKMAPVIRRIYDQMLEPKWVIAMGACSSSGGVFSNYAIVQGADKFLPVDVHIPGCPPRPEAVIHGLIKLQRKIKGHPDQGWRERYAAHGTEEWPYGAAGAPDGVDLEQLIAERRAQGGNGRADAPVSVGDARA
ncbi:MAG: NADH-quinone oxidoreductase subunit B family protein [Solirubrobacterales bacterium]